MTRERDCRWKQGPWASVLLFAWLGLVFFFSCAHRPESDRHDVAQRIWCQNCQPEFDQ